MMKKIVINHTNKIRYNSNNKNDINYYNNNNNNNNNNENNKNNINNNVRILISKYSNTNDNNNDIYDLLVFVSSKLYPFNE